MEYRENLSVLQDTQRVGDAFLVVGLSVVFIDGVDLVTLGNQAQIELILHKLAPPLRFYLLEILISRHFLIGRHHDL